MKVGGHSRESAAAVPPAALLSLLSLASLAVSVPKQEKRWQQKLSWLRAFFLSVCCSPCWCWGEDVWAMKSLVSLGPHPCGWVGKQLKARTAVHSLAAGPADQEKGFQNVFQPLKHHRRRPCCGRAVEGPGWVMAEACLGPVLSAEGAQRRGDVEGRQLCEASWVPNTLQILMSLNWSSQRKFLRNWGLNCFTLTTSLLPTGHCLWQLVVFMCAFRPHQLSLGET